MKLLALLLLVVSLFTVASVDKKENLEFERALNLATQGDALEIYNTAYYYQKGLGVKPDFKEAKKWFNKAELTESGAVHFKLGRLYETGAFFDKDMKKAVKHYHFSAKQGDPLGMNNYGLLLIKGQYIMKNEIEGIKWLELAANARMQESSMNLGLYYYDQKNMDKAKLWFEKASKANNVRSQVVLAKIYLKERNYKQALIYYKQAADNDNAEAKYYLAMMADKGLGMDKSPTSARKWLEESAKLGYEKAKRVLNRTRESIMQSNKK